jgi:hypothetical protein
MAQLDAEIIVNVAECVLQQRAVDGGMHVNEDNCKKAHTYFRNNKKQTEQQ